MERIALIYGHIYIYWSAVLLTLAAAAAVCAFLALYLGKTGKTGTAVTFVPLAMTLSLLLARLVHWYCRPDAYESLTAAMDLRTPGGFALMGVFGGCLLAALLLRLLGMTHDLPELLDCACLAGGVGIAVGRLSAFFNSSDRGMAVTTVQTLPWVSQMTDPVSGVTEYRLAAFLLQAMIVGLITLLLLIWYLAGWSKERRSGDACLLFLMFYGASQVVLDSTRYDSLYFRSNGFVSVVQVLGAVCLAVGVIVFSVRLVRASGLKWWHPGLWLVQGICFGLAGCMEYHVQRYGNQAVFAYSVMSGALAVILTLAVLMRWLAGRAERKQAMRLFEAAEF